MGDDNWIMAYVSIAHDCRVGNRTTFANNAQLAGHVHIDDWAILADTRAFISFAGWCAYDDGGWYGGVTGRAALCNGCR